MRPITAATRIAAVVGHPVRHSLSPVIHNAAFGELGLDWVFVAFDVERADGAPAFAGIKALGIDGLSVTMPLKEVAAASVDRLSSAAKRLGAVNTIVREGAVLVGHNTDGQGFLDALATSSGWAPAGKRCAVLGAGGAARAVVLALAEEAAAEVAVINRTPARAEAAAALAGPLGRVATLDSLSDADLIVNATPVGMAGAGTSGTLVREVGSRLRGSGQVLVDLVYHPVRTELLALAEAAGVTAVDGVGMLVHQAARAFELWTGSPAPVAVMASAARAQLAARA